MPIHIPYHVIPNNYVMYPHTMHDTVSSQQNTLNSSSLLSRRHRTPPKEVLFFVRRLDSTDCCLRVSAAGEQITKNKKQKTRKIRKSAHRTYHFIIIVMIFASIETMYDRRSGERGKPTTTTAHPTGVICPSNQSYVSHLLQNPFTSEEPFNHSPTAAAAAATKSKY